MKNTNVLAGMKCPKCRSLGPFRIAASCLAEVEDDGVESTTDFEWGDDSPCGCVSCGFDGTVAQFKTGK